MRKAIPFLIILALALSGCGKKLSGAQLLALRQVALAAHERAFSFQVVQLKAKDPAKQEAVDLFRTKHANNLASQALALSELLSAAEQGLRKESVDLLREASLTARIRAEAFAIMVQHLEINPDFARAHVDALANQAALMNALAMALGESNDEK